MATLTVNPVMLRLLGLTPDDLRTPMLTSSAASARGGLLVYEGFNLARPIQVGELENGQGFQLTQ